MSMTIDELEVKVQSSSSSAATELENLSNALMKVRNAVRGGLGLTVAANQITKLSAAAQSIDGTTVSKIEALASALQKLKSVGNIKISASIGNQITKIASSVSALNTTDFSGVDKLVTGLQPLSTINKMPGLQSVLTQLSKLPTLSQALSSMDWKTISDNIDRLSKSLEPLVVQLRLISSGLVSLPPPLKKLLAITQNIPAANQKAAQSYVNLWAKIDIAKNVLKSAATTIASWITLSNSYVEDLNLFNVAMGEYAEAAREYAEEVSNLMGIDPGEWMRNQGTFMTIISGFGVVSDRAYVMSQNLTQLGYDLSSLFNISYEDSFQKLQSGISGELEPLRRLGFDLSVARLQQEALTLGISENVNEMTQAEKAQLRYYAIMTQVTSAQGDMARTLEAPANQLRVLQSQVTQCGRALGNIFIPVLNAILPYAIALTKVLRLLAEQVANIMGFTLPEVDYSGIASASGSLDGLGDSADSVADGLENSSNAAKKLKNNLLGIDELNVLSSDDSSGSLGDAVGSGLDFELPTYDFIGDAVTSKVDEIVDYITNALGEITATISAFSLAIGTILVVTGANIPVGLALMATGAAGLIAAIAMNWQGMSDQLASALTLITSMLGGFLLALGAFFVFSGVNIPLGAALMAAGAISLATAVAINWKFLEGNLKVALAAITAIVGGALLAIGAFLAFSGAQVPLGAALMAAGAVVLTTAVALNWDSLPDEIKRVLGEITTIVGSAMLALGAILALSGVSLPVGLALMAGGAVSLVAAVALNWDALTSDLKTSILTITGLVSSSLLGVGAILAWTGVATALGVSMMAVGAIGLVATSPINWQSLIDTIANVLKELGAVVGVALLALGAVLALSGVALPIGIALLAAGAVSLVSGIALNWNTIVNTISPVFDTLKKIISGAEMALGVILTLSGLLPLGIALIAHAASSFFGLTKETVDENAIANAVDTSLGNAVKVCEDYEPKWKSVGKNILLGIKDGITGTVSTVVSAARDVGEKLLNAVKEKLDINSPSGKGKEIGYWFDQGVSDGLTGNTDILEQSGKLVGAAIVGGVESALEGQGENVALGFIEDTANALSENKNRIENALSGDSGLSNIIGLVEDISSGDWKGVAKKVASGLFNSLDSELKDSISGFVADSLEALNEGFEKDGYIGVAKAAGKIAVNFAKALNDGSLGIDLANNELFSSILSGLENVADKTVGLSDFAANSLETLNLAFKENGYKGMVTAAKEIVRGLADNLKLLSGDLFTAGKDQVGAIISGIKSILPNIAGFLGEGISGIVSVASNVISGIGSVAGGGLSGIVSTVGGMFGSLASTVGGAMATAGSSIASFGAAAASALGPVGVVGVAAVAGVAIAGLSSKVHDYAKEAKSSALEAGDYLQAIFWNFVEVGTWLPAKVFEIGKKIVLALVDGIKSVVSAVYDTIKSIASNILDFLNGLWENVKSIASGILSSVSGIFGGLFGGGASSGGSDEGGSKKPQGIIQTVVSGVGSVVSGIGNAVSSVVSGVGNFVSNAWNGVKDFFGFANGGVINANGVQYMGKNIPHYANGTSNARGSLFVAGESGAELVGHINGNTEVMNRFQLAVVMRDAVVNGMSLYTPYWRSILSQMTICTNGIIRAMVSDSATISGTFASADSASSYNSLSRNVYNGSVSDDDGSVGGSMYGEMREFYQEYVEPTLKEIAADAKRQADKNESFTVRVGDRDISDAVDRQKKANGFSFSK